MVVCDPPDANEHKTQYVAEKFGRHRQQAVFQSGRNMLVLRLGNMNLQYEKRNDDREDSIAECLDPRSRHFTDPKNSGEPFVQTFLVFSHSGSVNAMAGRTKWTASVTGLGVQLMLESAGRYLAHRPPTNRQPARVYRAVQSPRWQQATESKAADRDCRCHPKGIHETATYYEGEHIKPEQQPRQKTPCCIPCRHYRPRALVLILGQAMD